MIDVNDRVPLYPGRVKMTPVSGQTNVYDMVRADQPQKDGTPLTRNTFRRTQADIRAYPIATGNSVTAGDVVDVADGEVTRSVVAEANVENVYYSGNPITSNDVCRLNDNVSVISFNASNIAVCLVDNQTGNIINSQGMMVSGTKLFITRLNDTQFIVGYASNTIYYLVVGTVNGTNISFGSSIGNSVLNSGTYGSEIIPISATEGVCFTCSGTALCGVPFSVNNSTITMGSQYYTPSTLTLNANSISAALIPDDSSGNKRVCVCFSDTNDGSKGKAVIATINSSNVVTWGSMVAFNDAASYLISCASNGNTVVVSYANDSACCCRVLAVNGTSITAGSQTQFEKTEIKAESSVVCIGGKFVVCGHGQTSGGAVSGSYAIVLNVSGLNITANTAYKFDPASAFYLRACPISDNKLIIAYADNGNNNYGTSTILEVNGNQIAGGFTVNSTQAIALESGEAGQEIEVIFAGTTAADFITEGQKIPSDGVYGYGPMTGWLNVIPYWAKEAGVRIATGSYVGTDKSGSANPNMLTFEFEPKLLVISGDNGSQGIFVINSVARAEYSNSNVTLNVKWEGKTVTWWARASNEAAGQLNSGGTTYCYVAIG